MLSLSQVFLVVVVEPVNWNSLHVADLAEERHHGQPHEAAVVRDHGLHGQRRAFGEHDDHRLLGGGEVAHDRNHADHERLCVVIEHRRLLAVEQRDLRRLQHVAAAIALGGLDEEERLEVAEDGKAKAGHRHRRAELRHGQVRSCPA